MSSRPQNIFPCCCCPPPVAALLCLYCRSGCSKGTVAGALTFFPPRPPNYTFRRVNMFGEALVDESQLESLEEDPDLATAVGGATIVTGAGEGTVITGADPGGDARVNGKVVFGAGHPERSEKRPAVRRSGGAPRASTPAHRAPTPLPHRLPGVSAGTRRKMAEGTAPAPEPPPPVLRPSKPTEEMTEGELRRYVLERDRRDAQDGVRHAFVPEARVRPADGGFLASIVVQPCAAGAWGRTHVEGEERSPRSRKMVALEAVKLYNKRAGSYVAAVVARQTYRECVSGKSADGYWEGKVMIYSHGNATDIGGMHAMQLMMVHALDITVIMYDYSGYGESGGAALENNTYSDIEVIYEHVTKTMKTHPDNVLLYGQSVGSGPSCYLAAKKPVGGLILHSAFMSGMRVLTPSRILGCLDIFPNITRIKKVNCPVFIIHGMLDEEVDMHHGVSLYNAVKEDCRREPWWVPDRGHNDITEGSAKMNEYLRKLGKFIRGLDEDFDGGHGGTVAGGVAESHVAKGRKEREEIGNI